MSEVDYTVTSVEDAHGRILSGVGATVADLEKTMERHAPDEPVASPEPSAPAGAQPPKESRGQKRFAQLTSERDKEKNAREAVERERDELKARLAAAPVAEPQSRPIEPASRETRPIEQTRPKPTEAEVGAKYETYADFVEDLADWKAEQRLAALDLDARISSRIEGDRASRTHADRVKQIHDRGRQAYPDFDAMLNAPHMQATGTWSSDKIAMIAGLEAPEHIQYALGKDPQLAERLRTEPNLGRFAMDLSRLMPPPAVASPASTAGAGSSMPPAPYQPVGSGSKTTAPPLDDLVKKAGHDFDKSGYREQRAAQLGRTRRR